MAFSLYAPAAYSVAQAASGVNYTADGNGLVTGIPLVDVLSLLEAGWTISATQPAATITALNAVNATVTGLLSGSAGAALTAAGTTQANALLLTKNINDVTTAASGTGVKLPAPVAGMRVVIFNTGANTIAIYGNASDTIDGTAGATGVTLTAAHRGAEFFATSATTWRSALLGAVST